MYFATMITSLVLVPLLLVPPVLLANISLEYHNYEQTWGGTCGQAQRNKRSNGSDPCRHRSAPYMISGHDSHPGEWPFVAWVQLNTTNCTGVIVDSDVVVTAGHCLFGLGIDEIGMLTELDGKVPAFARMPTVEYADGPDVTAIIKIKKVQGGAYYKKRGISLPTNPDFARLWLKERIDENRYLKVICISSSPDAVWELMKTPLFFISWGLVQQDPEQITPKTPQWAQMKPSKDEIYVWGKKGNLHHDSSAMAFIAYDNRKFVKTCPGDSGGPLVALDENGLWSLVGISIGPFGNCSKENGDQHNIFTIMPNILGLFDKNFKPLPKESAYDV